MNSPAASHSSSRRSPYSELSEEQHSVSESDAPLRSEDFKKRTTIPHIWSNSVQFATATKDLFKAGAPPMKAVGIASDEFPADKLPSRKQATTLKKYYQDRGVLNIETSEDFNRWIEAHIIRPAEKCSSM